jgi:hypothetical protein
MYSINGSENIKNLIKRKLGLLSKFYHHILVSYQQLGCHLALQMQRRTYPSKHRTNNSFLRICDFSEKESESSAFQLAG